MQSVFRTALGAFFTALVSAAFAISFAAIIYTGDLARFLEQGIGLTLLGATVISVAGAFTLSFRGSILGPQDVPAILVSTSVASIFAGSQLPPDALFATIACLIAVCAVSAGVMGALVGHFRLAYIARFLPYPVLAGFLATTGLLLLMAGIDIGLADTALPAWGSYLSGEAMLRWGPVAVAAVLIVVGLRVFDGFLVMPLALTATLAGFYAFYMLSGYSMDDLRAAGLLLGPFRSGGFLDAVDPQLPMLADWAAILAQAPLILSVCAATLIGATLNASGLELQLEQDFDINQEIRATGVANILSGLAGGIPGYHVVGETLLANRLGLIGATAGLSSAAGCGVLLLFGADLLTALPVGFFAAVIAFLGVDLLYTWFWEERRRFGWADYGVVVVIPLVAVSFGFLTAIAVGLLLACALFVLAYARLDSIRFQSDVSKRRSRVERAESDLAILAAQGHGAVIVELSGYLFFGSANALRTTLHGLMEAAPQLRWLLLDFANVSGLDVSTRHTIKRIAADCAARDVQMVLTGLGAHAAGDLRAAGPGIGVHETLDAGIEQIEETLILEGRDAAPSGPGLLEEIMHLFHANDLTAYVETLRLEQGQTVIAQGAESRDVYLLKTGKLRVQSIGEKGQTVVLAHILPGAVVGEMANYIGGARTAAIVAAEPATLICIRMADFATLEAQRPDVALAFHKLMARVLARRLQRTSALIRDLGV